VNLVEDGAQLLNWSWGVHRMGTLNLKGEPIDTNVRSDLAVAGYEMLLERFFQWLKTDHPNVVVVNSAGNSASTTDDHLPASLVSDQLLVVGGHQRSQWGGDVVDARYVVRRGSSNVGPRIDINAASCPNPPRSTQAKTGRGAGCGTSYAAALVTGMVAAMLSIDPELKPKQIRALLRQSALLMQPGDSGLTRPVNAGRQAGVTDSGNGGLARLDMYQALLLVINNRERSKKADAQLVEQSH